MKKKHTAEQIVGKLREAELELARGLTTGAARIVMVATATSQMIESRGGSFAPSRDEKQARFDKPVRTAAEVSAPDEIVIPRLKAACVEFVGAVVGCEDRTVVSLESSAADASKAASRPCGQAIGEGR